MMMRLSLITITLFSLFVFTACNQDNREEAITNEETDRQFEQVKNSDPNQPQQLSNTEIANHLANIASDVPNVNDAVSVVAGPYAVVGIDVDKDLDRSRVGTIKYSVLEALYDDPYGKTAVVIADADANERIRGMADKIEQGQPIYGIVDELAAVVGRYMPEFPINKNRPKESDPNKEVIPENEKEQLEDTEEEQSNHYKQNES
ncbi:YhcN/YlaJ family sporulation lipoprotein [Virgibacillus pantothenticus]|nr:MULTISPECIES: YhcN/YlaJ family sporulation lipoprotein [Virgibacillus]MBS7429824.1 YhcN/YlaJ family sporulation lipoprotein [Virgibacillus sp. 19R1-5]MBU8565082.1 YhcN/YlaJ family sporulation lipoprotein [Virgibacillus pantothenticus]MBU8601028.1 YhcN/YlaJ family sporulation lipoprotein [Virgibacillus pantothenticus]MBU8633209.1 YhcN/YlaJ family sporulation lipoprotein [Virgibacillus pantothenticus]MBU8643853.1 YhcN/YlaJ family sporulation lipoprotein [Virgibacillus pantothenticus]